MLDPDLEPFTQSLATALFSFLYHLASYESGCEALVASGLIESLLKVVVWPGENEHITVNGISLKLFNIFSLQKFNYKLYFNADVYLCYTLMMMLCQTYSTLLLLLLLK